MRREAAFLTTYNVPDEGSSEYVVAISPTTLSPYSTIEDTSDRKPGADVVVLYGTEVKVRGHVTTYVHMPHQGISYAVFGLRIFEAALFGCAMFRVEGLYPVFNGSL